MDFKLIIEGTYGANTYVADERNPEFSIGVFSDIEIAKRVVAAWNYCHGVPTAELESKGADAGFWGRACSVLETKNEKLEAQNAALLAAVKEMERMLLPLERLEEGLPQTWEAVNIGTGIATLNGYRDTLEKALEAVKNNNQ